MIPAATASAIVVMFAGSGLPADQRSSRRAPGAAGGCGSWMPPLAPDADSFTSTFSVKSRITAPGPV